MTNNGWGLATVTPRCWTLEWVCGVPSCCFFTTYSWDRPNYSVIQMKKQAQTQESLSHWTIYNCNDFLLLHHDTSSCTCSLVSPHILQTGNLRKTKLCIFISSSVLASLVNNSHCLNLSSSPPSSPLVNIMLRSMSMRQFF